MAKNGWEEALAAIKKCHSLIGIQAIQSKGEGRLVGNGEHLPLAVRF